MTMTLDPARSISATSATVNPDRDAIEAVRHAFVDADNAGDAEAMAQLLADDIVVLHPHCGAFEGKEAVRSGDLAYERGLFRQQLTPRSGGAIAQDEGMYLWIYTRRDERWRIARIAGTFKTAEESTDGQTEEVC
jgi:ketosteroid isomerase-like protein